MHKLKKVLPPILISVFVLSLIPLLVMAFYNHPAHDDYYYGIKTHLAAQSGNLFDVLSAAVDQVKESYSNWQGTYSAVFLFSLQPAIFGESYYAITTFIMLSALIASSLLFSYVLLRRIFSTSRQVYILSAITVLMLSIHLCPSPVQAYYWYNASVYYTFFYSLTLVFFSLLYYLLKTGKTGSRIALEIAAIALSAIIGGGNYVSALLTAIVLFLIMSLLSVKKDKRAFLVLPIFVIFIAAFLISIIAPGNAVRAENYAHISAIEAILSSIRYAFYYAAEWLDVTTVIALLLLTPFIARAAAKSKLSFRCPLIVTAIAFLVFAAQFCPLIYGTTTFGNGDLSPTSGEARTLNIIYYSFFYFALIVIYYIAGCISRKHGDFTVPIFNYFYSAHHTALISGAVAIAILLPSVAPSGEMEIYRGGGTAFTSAMYSLITGEAQKWDEENNKRYDALTDESIKCVEFTPFRVTPALLYYGDLTQDKDWMWSNAPMRTYFDKEYVITRWYE